LTAYLGERSVDIRDGPKNVVTGPGPALARWVARTPGKCQAGAPKAINRWHHLRHILISIGDVRVAPTTTAFARALSDDANEPDLLE
jgi:hypothetical protein